MAKHAYTNDELDAEIIRQEWEIESSPSVDGAAVLDAVHAAKVLSILCGERAKRGRSIFSEP
jgi:hypothetical protein